MQACGPLQAPWRIPATAPKAMAKEPKSEEAGFDNVEDCFLMFILLMICGVAFASRFCTDICCTGKGTACIGAAVIPYSFSIRILTVVKRDFNRTRTGVSTQFANFLDYAFSVFFLLADTRQLINHWQLYLECFHVISSILKRTGISLGFVFFFGEFAQSF